MITGHAVVRINWLVRRGFLLFQGGDTPYNALQIRFTLLLSISTLFKGTCLSQCVQEHFPSHACKKRRSQLLAITGYCLRILAFASILIVHYFAMKVKTLRDFFLQLPSKSLRLLAFSVTLHPGEKPIPQGYVSSMPNVQQLLDDAAITVSELARRANVDYRTARKAVDGDGPIQRVKALALLRVLNELLGTSYRPEDIAGLEID